LAWSRNGDRERRGPFPLGDLAFWISIAVGIVLALLVVYLMSPASKLHAVAFGYAAPDVLVRGFGAAVGKPPTDRAAPSLLERLIRRWQP
jgi:hypothetical protein